MSKSITPYIVKDANDSKASICKICAAKLNEDSENS